MCLFEAVSETFHSVFCEVSINAGDYCTLELVRHIFFFMFIYNVGFYLFPE
jgi:hypothetical protein